MAARVTVLKTRMLVAVDRSDAEPPTVPIIEADDAPLAPLMAEDPDQLPGRGRDPG